MTDPAPEDEAAIDATKAPLMDHLTELRNRLLICALAFFVLFCAGFAFAQPIYAFLVEPLAAALVDRPGERRMIYTGLAEAFVTYVKVAFFAGAFFSFPVWATQVWRFVAPGLYKAEKRAVLPFLLATPVLFFAGAALAYYLIFPMAFKFFLSFESAVAANATALPIQLEAKVDQYLSLVMGIVFAFGLSFELPVLLMLMARAGLINAAMLSSKRRHAIVLIFIVAAVITPPDVISQIGLAVPMMLLYEISIFGVKRIDRARAKRQAAEAAA